MNKPTTFYIVRHAQSHGNIKKIISGQIDTNLSEPGVQQAIRRGEDFFHIHFDAVFSSDLTRAKETAEFIIAKRALTVATTKVLRERNKGDVQGSSYDKLDKKLKKLLDKHNSMSYEERFSLKLIPGMESDEEVVTRFIDFLREKAKEYPGKTVLIVCHGDIMRTLLVHLGFSTHSELPHGTVQNTGYFVLKTDGETFRIEKTVGIEKKQA